MSNDRARVRIRSIVWRLLPIPTLLAAAWWALGPIPAAQAQSIDGLPPSLAGSGWASCDEPIRWVIDTSQLTQRQAERVTQRVAAALDIWAAATGLHFTHAGQVKLALATPTRTLTPADGTPVATRTILIAFKDPAEAPMLDSRTYGVAGPTLIMRSNLEIVGGYAILRADLARASGRSGARVLDNVILHELGHVLGVGHVPDAQAVMNPVVRPIGHAFPADLAIGSLPIARPCITPGQLGA